MIKAGAYRGGERRQCGPRFASGFLQAFEATTDLVCVCKAGAIVSANSSGLAILGATQSETVIGKDFATFLTGIYSDSGSDFLPALALENAATPLRLKGLDGVVRDVEILAHRAREIDAEAIVLIIRDITRQHVLAGKAQRSSALFRAMVDNSMHLICHCVDGRVRYLNPAGCRLLGVNGSEIIGQPLHVLFHEEYSEIVQEEPEVLFCETGAVPVQLAGRGGVAVDAQVSASRLAAGDSEWMIEARDISAHNRAVSALRQLNDELEARVIERTRESNVKAAEAIEQRRIAEQASRFTQDLIETIPLPVWYKDSQLRFELYNRAFRETFQIKAGDWAGKTVAEIGHSKSIPLHEEIDKTLLKAPDCSIYESATQIGDERREVIITKSTYCDAEGRPVGIIGVMMDITERKEMERELVRLATTDSLTGVWNRRYFLEQSARELARARRAAKPVALIMLDIDHFKSINDTYGHPVGDDAIRALVGACSGILRPSDGIGRLGGEEFAIILPGDDTDSAMTVCERLRQAISQIVVSSDHGDVTFTASFGMALAMAEDTGAEAALSRADEALYHAKRSGRNRVVAWREEPIC